jgi:hypothetical protein
VNQGSIPGKGQASLFSAVFGPVLMPTQSPLPWIQGTLSLGMKWPGCGTDCSAPLGAEGKNAWISTSASPIHHHGMVFNQIQGELSLHSEYGKQ